jgi:hypothetical protein
MKSLTSRSTENGVRKTVNYQSYNLHGIEDEVVFHVSLQADLFPVPFGCCFEC